MPSAARRVLPDFLIIGGQRCGTTSLYRYLSQHPDVVPPVGKELQFFTSNWGRGPRWYRAHFPRAMPEGRTRPPVTFEATPYYAFHPLAAARAAEVVPAARLVLLVRHPVDRAVSHYQHVRRLGLEPLSFEEAIASEPRRLRGEVERMLREPAYESRSHKVYSYVSRGQYMEQIERWLEHFPRERLLVVRSEDLFDAPDDVYAEVLEFLELAPWAPEEFAVHTRGGGSGGTRHDEQLPNGLREALLAEFEPQNRALEAFLGRPLGWDR